MAITESFKELGDMHYFPTTVEKATLYGITREGATLPLVVGGKIVDQAVWETAGNCRAFFGDDGYEKSWTAFPLDKFLRCVVCFSKSGEVHTWTLSDTELLYLISTICRMAA